VTPITTAPLRPATSPSQPDLHVLNVKTLPADLDLVAFSEAIEALEAEAERAHPAAKAASDLAIFASLSFACSAVGWGAAIFGGVNVLAIAALAMSSFSRWIFAHHVCHGAYDRTDKLPAFVHSRKFGRDGWRWLHWLDWMTPEAWAFEHNGLHHYQLNQPGGDPDLVEGKTMWLRSTNYPNWLKVTLAIIGGCFWKPMYYGPNVLLELWNSQSAEDAPKLSIESDEVWRPWHRPFWQVMARAWFPYIFGRFVLPTLVVYGIWGSAASIALAINLVAAELLTNIYTFFVIVSNHAGEDLYRFAEKPASKGEFYWRQITGSCNYYRHLVSRFHPRLAELSNRASPVAAHDADAISLGAAPSEGALCGVRRALRSGFALAAIAGDAKSRVWAALSRSRPSKPSKQTSRINRTSLDSRPARGRWGVGGRA